MTRQECLALDLPCSSRLLVHGSSWHACQDLSASLSRMHARHFESSLDLIMLTIFLKQLYGSFDHHVEDKMLLEYDDSLATKRSTQLSIVQQIDFSFLVICGFSPFSTH